MDSKILHLRTPQDAERLGFQTPSDAWSMHEAGGPYPDENPAMASGAGLPSAARSEGRPTKASAAGAAGEPVPEFSRAQWKANNKLKREQREKETSAAARKDGEPSKKQLERDRKNTFKKLQAEQSAALEAAQAEERAALEAAQAASDAPARTRSRNSYLAERTQISKAPRVPMDSKADLYLRDVILAQEKLEEGYETERRAGRKAELPTGAKTRIPQQFEKVLSEVDKAKLRVAEAQRLLLKGAQVKHTAARILGSATQVGSGHVIFLEQGNKDNGGLEHILYKHGGQFTSAGISEEGLPAFLLSAAAANNRVGWLPRAEDDPKEAEETVREVFEHQGRYVAMVISANGFIVTAFLTAREGVRAFDD